MDVLVMVYLQQSVTAWTHTLVRCVRTWRPSVHSCWRAIVRTARRRRQRDSWFCPSAWSCCRSTSTVSSRVASSSQVCVYVRACVWLVDSPQNCPQISSDKHIGWWLVGRLEGHSACVKLGVGLLVVTIWLETAHLIAPVVATTSIILSSNKIQNGDILVSANPGPCGKRPLNWREMSTNWGWVDTPL